MKKRTLYLLLLVSLAANIMVFVTWLITVKFGVELFTPSYLFKNIIAVVFIVAVNVIFGWFYSRRVSNIIIGGAHFAVATTTFLLLGRWANWFPTNSSIILTATIIFIAIWLISWLAHYMYWKNEIKQINNKLG